MVGNCLYLRDDGRYSSEQFRATYRPSTSSCPNSLHFPVRRFAFHDYNRLAAEDERDVGDPNDIDGSDDWIVTDDDEDTDDVLGRLGQDGCATAEAPF